MTYSVGKIAKAVTAAAVAFIGAAVAGAHGADISTLDLGGWLTAAGAGLTAGGATFGVPNAKDPEPEAPSPADQVISALPVLVDRANSAVADLERVKQAASNAIGSTPVVGPLAKEALDQILNR